MTPEIRQQLRAGVFIDGSNLFWSMNMKDDKGSTINYKIAFDKLKTYLEGHFNVAFLHYYACEDNGPVTTEYAIKAIRQKKFHRRLEKIGYTMIKKPLKHLGRTSTKCDMDVEIVLGMHTFVDQYDIIILISGDSDFYAALTAFHELGKNIVIMSIAGVLSWELKNFAMRNPLAEYRLFDSLRKELEF